MCDAGYFCTLGAKKPRPDNDSTEGGNICPAGGYCEQGSSVPKFCLGGYYNDETGKKTVYDCKKCPPGKYCAGEGISSAGSNCKDGYYCTSGSPVAE